MMTDRNEQLESERHEAVWELLPWYVNNTLKDPDRKTVARHISECQMCEEEAARCRTIADAVRGSEVAAWTPSSERVARMMARIDVQSAAANGNGRRFNSRAWFEKIRLILQESPSSVRWTLAAQTAVIVLLAAAIVLQLSAGPSLLYRTLSDPSAGLRRERTHIQVIFADDMTEREIRTLLNDVGAAIVAGPTPIGLYTLAIAAESSETDGRIQEKLTVLRAHPKVQLAEPKGQ
jgi:anti-sigma factor RsiW